MPRLEGTDDGSGIYRPMIDVFIELPTVGKRSPPILAVIDSGADQTIVPFDYLKAAGVEWDKLSDPKQGTGAGGGFETRMIRGTITWKNYFICDQFQVAQPGMKTPLLLGREDFFKKFVVRFNWHQTPPTFNVDPVK